MEGGALFNSGFLGASFNWWIGQIADDATWRDNILPGKFESANQIPGWGRRYKVRIIGLHDQGETEIKSDQLPWAQVMYPVTAGGGQGASGQTPNLRQGNMVFGFFLDGQEQQVPVIMGVLGNNAQTQLATKIGDGRVTNTQPGSLATSGNAVSASGDTDTNRKVPDDDKVSAKPTPPGTPPATPKPGVVLDRFGIDPTRPLTRAERNAQQSAIAEADRLGETGAVREARIANAVVAATRQEAEAAASPASPAVPGATIENPDAIHRTNTRDTKSLDQYLKKTVLLSPCDPVGSSMKGMQTEIENLTKDIDKVLQTKNAYVDAVSEVTSKVSDITRQVTKAAGQVQGIAGQVGDVAGQVGGIVGQVQGIAGGIDGIGDIPGALGGIGDLLGQVDDSAEKIEALMEQYTPKLAKHMKVVTNKIGEYTSKKINEAIGPLADTMFPNQRFQFLDMKIEINEKLKCLFSKITDGLGAQILGALKKGLDKKTPSAGKEDLPAFPGNVPGISAFPGNAPVVPICSVEKLTGDIIATNMEDIDTTIKEITKSVESFLNDIQTGPSVAGQVGDVAGQIGDVAGQVGDVAGQVGGIAGQIGGIAGQVGGIAGQVGGIAGQIGGIAGQVGGLLGGLGGLGGIKIPDIGGSIASALSFENITLNIFGCDAKPNCPVSDFYTLQEGGGAAEEPARPGEVSKKATDPNAEKIVSEPISPIATPANDTQDLLSAENTRLQGNETSGSFNPGGAASGGTLAE